MSVFDFITHGGMANVGGDLSETDKTKVKSMRTSRPSQQLSPISAEDFRFLLRLSQSNSPRFCLSEKISRIIMSSAVKTRKTAIGRVDQQSRNCFRAGEDPKRLSTWDANCLHYHEVR